MASIVKHGKGKMPLRSIDFSYPANRRHRLRLGVVSSDTAKECCRQVEKLIEARCTGQPLDLSTGEWLNQISDSIYESLVRFGLCKPRARVNMAPSVEEWVTKYIDQRRGDLKTGSIERLEQSASRIKKHFGKTSRIDEVTPDSAADWRAAMLANGLSEATTRLHCRNAKSIFAEAERRELIRKNPFGRLKSSSIAAQRKRNVTAEEATNILKACPSLDWQVLFGLARFGGLRIPSESHILTWENVDWERKLLRVYAPKTDSTRVVPIVPRLMEILKKARELAAGESETIVQMSTNNLHRNFEKLLKAAKIEVWDDLFQTLRRSCETDFAKHHPQGAVSRWIGHSMRVSEQHYLMDDESVLDAATRLDYRGEKADSGEKKRAAESAAEGSRIVSQVEETRGNGGLVIGRKKRPKNEKTPGHQGFCGVAGGGIEPPTPGFSVEASTGNVQNCTANAY